MKKRFRIYYGDDEGDYIIRYLNENDIINNRLSEAKAFELFYSNMIMCNNYLDNNYDNLWPMIDDYDEDEDYYVDEYQIFIIDPIFDEYITIAATKKMGNTLYYDNKLNLYITGITDLGTSRYIVPTGIKVEEVIENEI